MPKIQTLSQSEVDRKRGVGRHAVARGLYLSISDTGRRQYWTRQTDEHGRRTWAVLGDARTMPLQVARRAALLEPERAADKTAAGSARTFLEAGRAYLAAHESGWKNEKHRVQWRRTVEVEARLLHRLKTDRLKPEDVALVLQALADIPETQRRCRNRIEMIIDAEVEGRLQRYGQNNPASLKAQRHLVAGFSKRATRRKRLAVQHHAAPTLDQVRLVWRALDWQSASHLALRWTLVTVARTTETRLLVPAELDLKRRLWKLSGGRMKSDRAHTVPLTDHALIVLAKAREEFPAGKTDYVFPGLEDEPLDINSQRQALQRLIRSKDEIEAGERLPTPHGIRATFRSWARSTGRNEIIAELCIAHEVDDDTVRAYTHGSNPMELQRKMLEEWAHEVCGPAPARILPLPKRGAVDHRAAP